MPNWVYNTFTVSDLTVEQADEIVSALKAGKLLNLILPEPDWETTPNEQGELPTKDEDGDLRFADGRDERWYYWRYKKWGTKWDVKQPDGVITKSIGSDLVELAATFETAWAPPDQNWLHAFMKRYPEVTIQNIYIEESEYHGVMVGKGGKVTNDKRGLEYEEEMRNAFFEAHPYELTGDEEKDEEASFNQQCKWSDERFEIIKESLVETTEKMLLDLDNRPSMAEFYKELLSERKIES
jgi:hypothetical protein